MTGTNRVVLDATYTAQDLIDATTELQQKLVELAEVEVAESGARIEGQAQSHQQSASGREQDGRSNALYFTHERIRLAAQVEKARLERETIIEVLRLPTTRE